jgi:Holliday junction DNA helicase RuvA
MIPFSTYYELPEEGPATLHIHTSVREDAIQLYGFRTRTEKSFFQLLISVSGVGPKLARDILSNIQPPQLASALMQSDLHKLSAIPGIGKKTAERLVLELKEKVAKLDAGVAHASDMHGRVLPENGVLDDVVSALSNLGYKEVQIRRVLAELSCNSAASVEDVLKQALKILMK